MATGHYIFGDFDDTLPTIEGFEDHSWKNDTCPKLYDDARQLKLFVDYKNPSLSEHSEARLAGRMHQFQLFQTDADGESIGESVLSTDDLDEVLEYVASYDNAAKVEAPVPGPRL